MTALSPQDAAKQAAAEAAVAQVRDGMTLGLGTGSTMDFALVALGRRIREEGLKVSGIPTSIRTEERARALGIPLTDFSQVDRLDLAIDGADEVHETTLALIKGLGGALLREKIVAAAAARFVVIVDRGKVVQSLGSRAPVPVEVVRFGHESTARRLAELGGAPRLRQGSNGPLVTDGGNLIYDCGGFAPITDPAALARRLSETVGVAGHGLFIGMADQAIVADADGGITRLHATSGAARGE